MLAFAWRWCGRASEQVHSPRLCTCWCPVSIFIGSSSAYGSGVDSDARREGSLMLMLMLMLVLVLTSALQVESSTTKVKVSTTSSLVPGPISIPSFVRTRYVWARGRPQTDLHRPGPPRRPLRSAVVHSVAEWADPNGQTLTV